MKHTLALIVVAIAFVIGSTRATIAVLPHTAGKFLNFSYGPVPVGIQDISKDTGLKFPKNTRVVGSEKTYGFQDNLLVCKLQIDRKDVPGLLRSVTFITELSETDRLGIENVGDSHKWWNPDSVQSFTAVRAKYGGTDGGMTMLISRDKPFSSMIYIWAKS